MNTTSQITQTAQENLTNGTTTPNYTSSVLDMQNAGINPLALYKTGPADTGSTQTTEQQEQSRTTSAKNATNAAKTTGEILGAIGLAALFLL